MALLHDVGKTENEVLQVVRLPQKLTNKEIEIINTHTTIGGILLRTQDFSDSIYKGALYHHTQYLDLSKKVQSGELTEKERLLISLLTIADVSEAAMSRLRTYKKPKMPGEMIVDLQQRHDYNTDITAILTLSMLRLPAAKFLPVVGRYNKDNDIEYSPAA